MLYTFLNILIILFIGLWNYSIPKIDTIDINHFNQDIKDFEDVPTF